MYRLAVRSFPILAAILIAAAPANSPPTASFATNPLSGPPTLTVNVDATASSDSDGTITSYGWDWGDSTTDSGVTASHNYALTGTYRITLMVTDNLGATGTVTQDVDCISTTNLPPTHTIGAFPTLGTGPLDVQVESLVHDDAGTHTEIWTPGDGSPQVTYTNVPNHAGTLLNHTYTAPGTYVVTNRAIDPEGIWREVTDTIIVTAAPPGGGGGGGGCGLTGIEVPLLMALLLLARFAYKRPMNGCPENRVAREVR